jgi:DNA-binding MarR family transcriptional regulator
VATQHGLPFDPIAEARRQWLLRWGAAEPMAAATSIMRAQQIVLAQVDAMLRAFNLTFARYEALVLLLFSRQGALPLGKMGDRLMVHPTSVTNTVNRLEAQGLVRRVPHPTDGRTILAEITPEGRDVVQKATQVLVEARFGLDALSDEESVELTRLVEVLRRGVGDFHDEPERPVGN